MVDQNVIDLRRIGLTEGEAKVYLALSEIGSSTVGPVVKKANVAYSNVYEILNRLIEKGIVSFIVKNKTRLYQAVSPSSLIDYLDSKELEIKNQKGALKEIVPRLEELQNLAPQQKAEIFIGKKGLRTAYERFIDNKPVSECLFFYVHRKRYAREADLFYFSVYDIISKTPQRGITNKLAIDSPFFKRYQKEKKVKVRYVDIPFPGNIEVCGNKVILVSWEKTVVATLIYSEDIANNIRDYFEQVWKISK